MNEKFSKSQQTRQTHINVTPQPIASNVSVRSLVRISLFGYVYVRECCMLRTFHCNFSYRPTISPFNYDITFPWLFFIGFVVRKMSNLQWRRRENVFFEFFSTKYSTSTPNKWSNWGHFRKKMWRCTPSMPLLLTIVWQPTYKVVLLTYVICAAG